MASRPDRTTPPCFRGGQGGQHLDHRAPAVSPSVRPPIRRSPRRFWLVKLSRPQRDVLARMATGGVLFVRLERTDSGVEETCWIGSFELHPMTVNALIAAGLIARQDEIRGKNG